MVTQNIFLHLKQECGFKKVEPTVISKHEMDDNDFL